MKWSYITPNIFLATESYREVSLNHITVIQINIYNINHQKIFKNIL